MLTEVKKACKFVVQYISANLQSAMEYRGSFLSQVVFMFLNNVMLLFFWWVFFAKIESLNGWEFREIMLLYAVASGAFAVRAVFFGGSLGLSSDIADGRLDFYLALPRPVLLHVLISRSMTSAWGDLLFSLVIFWLTARPSLGLFLGFLVLIVASGVVMTSFGVMAHSLSFWLGRVERLAGQLEEALLSFSTYPEGIFSAGTRFVFYTLIPAGFAAYLPVKILTEFSLGASVLVVGFAAGLTLLARFVFYRGLKRYESGNLVVLNTAE